jgi:hypothetical protein
MLLILNLLACNDISASHTGPPAPSKRTRIKSHPRLSCVMPRAPTAPASLAVAERVYIEEMAAETPRQKAIREMNQICASGLDVTILGDRILAYLWTHGKPDEWHLASGVYRGRGLQSSSVGTVRPCGRLSLHANYGRGRSRRVCGGSRPQCYAVDGGRSNRSAGKIRFQSQHTSGPNLSKTVTERIRLDAVQTVPSRRDRPHGPGVVSRGGEAVYDVRASGPNHKFRLRT